MARRQAQYPTQVFDGISTGNLDRFDRTNNVDPKYHDYDQLAAEVMATQLRLDEVVGQGETVTQFLYVDAGRTDTYIENGSILKPYKTVQAAIVIANGNCLINVAPGTYTGDINLGVHVATIRGSGLDATIFTGNIIAGDRPHLLEDFCIQSTGSLTITNRVIGQNLHLECAMVISGLGSFEGKTIIITPISGVVPLTISASTGTCVITRVYIVAIGDIHAINQPFGTCVLLDGYVTNNSLTVATIDSNRSNCALIDTAVLNQGFGPAITIGVGSSLATNTLSGVLCVGNISCGAAPTYVEGLNFAGFGSLSGTNFIYRPASRLNNDSSVTGATIKDALEGLDARITALGG